MEKPTFREALQFWIQLGFISFGGPAGQVAIMHEYLVTKRKWISESRFLHALNYCMLLPGPEAQQLATYIGWLLHGTWGGLAAGIFFVLPSMLILLILSILYVSFGNIAWIAAIFSGLKPAVIAVVILALIKMSQKSLLSPVYFMVALAAFTGIFFFNVPFPLIVLGAIVLAAFSRKVFPQLFAASHHSATQNEADENKYFINKYTVTENVGYRPLRLLKQCLAAAVLWLAPLFAFYLFSSDFRFWKELSVFFTKAACVTFGGAYAVLPYVAQVSVEKFHWLSHQQMIDGLALGETTPGPLVIVLAFVGFMAGYHHFANSITMGTIGLVATTFYTFLPGFLFIFAGVPIIERTHQNKPLKEILSLVTAAVVGVVLNLTIYLGKAVIFPAGVSFAALDYLALAWTLLSFIAMYRFQIGLITWIGISALYGLAAYGIAAF